MSISIELGFDADSTAVLRALSARVATSVGGEPIAAAPIEPHLSLALLPEDESAPSPKLLEPIVPLSRFPLPLAQAAAFDSPEGVVYLAPRMAPELSRCHEVTHEVLRRARFRTSSLYVPARWVAHCTVLTGVPSRARDDAIQAVQAGSPAELLVSTLRVFHYGRCQLLFKRDLRAA